MMVFKMFLMMCNLFLLVEILYQRQLSLVLQQTSADFTQHLIQTVELYSIKYSNWQAMKTIRSPLCLVALLLSLHMMASSVTTFNDTVTTSITNSVSYYPTYKLGVLKAGDVITMDFTLPNVSPNTSSSAFNAIPTSTYLIYIDPLNTTITAYKNALTENGTFYAFPAFANLSGSNTFYSATYTVSFGNLSITSATFFIMTINAAAYSGKTNYIYWTVSKNSAVILKFTDLQRIYESKIFYIDQPGNNTYQLSAYPAIANYTGGGGSTYQIILLPLHINSTGTTSSLTGNQWSFTASFSLYSQEYLANQSNPNYVNNIAHFNASLSPGYYLLVVFPAYTNIPNTTGWYTYPSARYTCPFDPAYPDTIKNFQPCAAAAPPPPTPANVTDNPILPCITYDYQMGVCTDCIPGYFIQDGSCMANTTCPPRQYFHFGNCIQVSSLCDGFDAFTGACLNCSNSANFNLVNGSCVEVITVCQFRQWQTNHTCFNVSESCKAYDINNGRCLSCSNPLEQLTPVGACVPIKVNCPSGQYAVGLTCITIPVECVSFNATAGKCLSCITGYFVSGGACERVVCPQGKVPSNYGVFCVDVSSLCNKYDPINGDCLTCKEAGYTVRGGKCLQLGSPLAGCQQRQAMGFGPCVGADLNCRTFNLISGDCDKCEEGYSIDYTGHCSKDAQCGPREWSVNGQCLGTPENCLKVDSFGFCTQCASADYRIDLGQCVFFKRCNSQQYLNSAGQCVDVSPSCATWNPSNGECITCKVPSGGRPIYPTKGVCCPQNQAYNIFLKTCVSVEVLRSSSQNSSGTSCISPHPSLNICLACPQGLSPDYTIPYGCA